MKPSNPHAPNSVHFPIRYFQNVHVNLVGPFPVRRLPLSLDYHRLLHPVPFAFEHNSKLVYCHSYQSLL